MAQHFYGPAGAEYTCPECGETVPAFTEHTGETRQLMGWWVAEGKELPPRIRDEMADVLPRAFAEGRQIVVIEGVTLRWNPAPDSIDAAWAEAEANGWEIVHLIRRLRRPERARWEAGAISYKHRPYRRLAAFGPTPATALRALAEKLGR